MYLTISKFLFFWRAKNQWQEFSFVIAGYNYVIINNKSH